jgi:hypothetical protein
VGATLLRVFRGIDTLRDGNIVIATATSTAGHVAALTRTPDAAQMIGEETAKQLLRLGDSPTPELAAEAYDLDGVPASARLELANYIQKYFWGSVGSFTGGFPVGAPGWNNRIDPDEVDTIRRRIQKRIEDPPHRTAQQGDDRASVEAWNRAQQAEASRIQSLLPKGGVAALPAGFILTAGATSILEDGLRDPENEASSARATYERTYHRKVKDERFIREMGQWARAVAENPGVAAMRARLLRGEKPGDEEVHALLGDFMALAAENAQGSTAIFSDDKDLLSLARWTILHAMAGEQNVLGLTQVQAELGSFAAGSSPDLTPVAIDKKRTEIQAAVAREKKRLDQATHNP